MVRKLLLTAAFALSSLVATGAAWADITMLVPSGSEGDGLRAAAADYSKLKGTKVEIVQAPYNNVFEQAANAGQTKSGAFDIVLMDDPWIPFFAENGHLEDLTAILQEGRRWTGRTTISCRSRWRICRNPYNTGPYVCMPYVGNAQMFFYDAAKFKEAGVDAPKTWDDVLKAAKALTDKGGGRYFGYVFRGGQGNPVVADFMPIFWSYGANLFNEDRTQGDDRHARGGGRDEDVHGACATSRRRASRATTPTRSARRSPPAPPPRRSTGRTGSRLSKIRASRGWSARSPTPPFRPEPNPAAPRSVIGPWASWQLPRTSRRPSTSCCGRPRRSRSRSRPTRGNPPVRTSAFTDPELTKQEKFRHYPVLMTAIEASTPRPRHPKWPEIENAFGIELSKAVAGTETPEEALKNSQAAVEKITGIK